jgi:hypothetical protein
MFHDIGPWVYSQNVNLYHSKKKLAIKVKNALADEHTLPHHMKALSRTRKYLTSQENLGGSQQLAYYNAASRHERDTWMMVFK